MKLQDINFRRGIFRIKVVLSVLILPLVLWYLRSTESWGWIDILIGTLIGTFFCTVGLWVGCWLIEKIGRWIIRGFTQTRDTK